MRNFNSLLFYVGLLTLITARLRALVELDLKKVVALRTLSQIGFLIITLGVGLPFYTLVHLVSHALFKRCLFLHVGYFMHTRFSSQDIRFLHSSGSLSLSSKTQLILCLLCLSGFTFTRGYLRKHIILSGVLNIHYPSLVVLILLRGVFITFLYSFRLIGAIIRVRHTPFIFTLKSHTFIYLSFILCVIGVSIFIWLNYNLTYYPIKTSIRDTHITSFYFLFFIVVILFIKHNLMRGRYKNIFNIFKAEYIAHVIQKFSFNSYLTDGLFATLGF